MAFTKLVRELFQKFQFLDSDMKPFGEAFDGCFMPYVSTFERLNRREGVTRLMVSEPTILRGGDALKCVDSGETYRVESEWQFRERVRFPDKPHTKWYMVCIEKITLPAPPADAE